MAQSKLALPLVFAFLLLSQVFARDLEEKPDNKDANVGDAKYPYGPGGGPYGPGPYHGGGPYGPGPYHGGGPYGRGPPYCRFYCHGRCCSAEEFAALFQADDAGDLNALYGPYGPGPRFPPRRPPYCRHYCGFRCCSAQEYAEFVQAGN